MPLLALLMLPLLLIVGFTVDAGLILNTKNQQALVVQHAALSSLSTYVRKLVDQTEDDYLQQAVSAAVERARRVAKTNVTLIDKSLEDKEDRIAVNTSDLLVKNAGQDSEEDVGAVLEFGRYYFGEDSALVGSQGGYAYSACPDGPPCFIPGNSMAPDNNAIRFTMNVPSRNAVLTYFMKLAGIKKVIHSESAIATLIPRNDVFLIDLSPTVYYDNYKPRGYIPPYDPEDEPPPAVPGSMSTFVFPLTAQPHAAYNTGYLLPEPGADSSLQTSAMACGESSGSPPSYCPVKNYSEIWNQMYYEPNPGHFSSSAAESIAKYRRDYRIYTVEYNSENPAAAYREHYLIHTEGDGPQGIAMPQPLVAILRSVHKGIEILVKRALSTDNLAIIGFDSESHTTTSEYGLLVSESPRNVDLGIPTLSDPIFNRFYEATALDSRASFDEMIRLGLFPRYRNSDLQAALFQGLIKISQSKTYKFGKNSIFLFTDGLANCPHRNVLTENGVELEIPYLHQPGSGMWPCNNKGRYVYEAIRTINEAGFIKAFKERQVAVSIALVGEKSGAHFLARKSFNRRGCMDNVEAATLSYTNFVRSGMRDYNIYTEEPEGGDDSLGGYVLNRDEYYDELEAQLKGDMPFFLANELYKIVNATKGLWLPIMPQAYQAVTGAGGSVSYVPMNFNEALQQACSNATVRNQIVTSGSLAVYDAKTGKPVVDSMGRVLFDPLGRTPEEQMKDAMEKVLQSPFLLASE